MTVMKRNIVLNIPHVSINGVFDPKYGGWPNNLLYRCKSKKTWHTAKIQAPFLSIKRNEKASKISWFFTKLFGC